MNEMMMPTVALGDHAFIQPPPMPTSLVSKPPVQQARTEVVRSWMPGMPYMPIFNQPPPPLVDLSHSQNPQMGNQPTSISNETSNPSLNKFVVVNGRSFQVC